MAMARSNTTPEGREGPLMPRVFAKGGEVLADSRDVAAFFEKEHFHILRDIARLIEQERGLAGEHASRSGCRFDRMFADVETANGARRTSPFYVMTSSAFMLLAMGFTGPKALQLKLAYIEEFDRMKAELRRRMAPQIEAPAVIEDLGESMRERSWALNAVREARILFGHGAARRMWKSMAVLPAAVSTDPDLREAGELLEDSAASDWQGALSHLLQWAMPLPEANGDNVERWIRAAAEMSGEWIQSRTPDEIRRALRAMGISVEAHHRPSVTIATSHPWLSACYLETAWAYGGWRKALAHAPGAEKVGPTRFGGHGRHTSRAVRIPMATILPSFAGL